MVASTSSSGVTGTGVPMAMQIGVRVRPSRLGRPLVQTRCDPQIVIGSNGTPASCAIRAAPLLNSLSSKEREIVASGKTPTISPRRSASTAAW